MSEIKGMEPVNDKSNFDNVIQKLIKGKEVNDFEPDEDWDDNSGGPDGFSANHRTSVLGNRLGNSSRRMSTTRISFSGNKKSQFSGNSSTTL